MGRWEDPARRIKYKRKNILQVARGMETKRDDFLPENRKFGSLSKSRPCLVFRPDSANLAYLSNLSCEFSVQSQKILQEKCPFLPEFLSSASIFTVAKLRVQPIFPANFLSKSQKIKAQEKIPNFARNSVQSQKN